MLQRCCHRWNRHAADAARGDRKGLDVLLVEQGLVESKTPGGSWKPGDYRVDLCIEDRKIGSKAFTVESSGVP